MTAGEALRTLDPRTVVFVAATGAGAGMQAALWEVPGSSAYLAGAAFPYAAHEVERFLGFRPARFCAEETALDLAIAAYLRAREAAGAEESAAVPLGLGLTASVASLTAHRGDHRVVVATLSPRGAAIWSARLEKGSGAAQRSGDGHLADELGLHALLVAAGVAGGQAPTVGAEISRRDASDDEVRSRILARPAFAPGGRRTTVSAEEARVSALLPGSFDPFHAGHRMMADAVEQQCLRRVIYTITADPVHKPRLRAIELLDRVASIAAQPGIPRTVAITCADPLFIDKARRFPGAGIVLGVDALMRMLDPAWGPRIAEMLDDFRSLGTRFYVVGRRLGDRWITLDDVPVPDAFADLFEAVEGRLDVSSTALRQERGVQAGA